MLKKSTAVFSICMLCLLALVSCATKDGVDTVTTTQGVDDAVYSDMILPNYFENNPVRYLDVDIRGFEYNGWQDFGLRGEIRTNAQNPQTTYVSQMYSYYIRNDLKHLYPDIELPKELAKLPEWLADTTADGRRAFWYSMGRLPESIELVSFSELTNESGSMKFVKAEYRVSGEDWVIYFMEDEGVYSAYAVKANESFDFVKTHSDTIIKSYQSKQ